jgi:3-phosphoshikimate 1-carboxyvinyltransferase
MERAIRAPAALHATVEVPGDKSISHRAAILNALASGLATVHNFLTADDCLATLDCLRALGVNWRLDEQEAEVTLTVEGVGLSGLREAEDVLDARNSGTTMRLLAGLLAGQPFLSLLTGDASLRSRPMARIVTPLREMGAQVWARAGDTCAPLAIRGGRLRGIRYRTPVASAQVKSAVLLAGLFAQGETTVEEPAASRDHTERMLAAMGAAVRREGPAVCLAPPSGPLEPLNLRVPGDLSAAAFWMVAAALHPDAQVSLPGVGLNPTRSGLIDALRHMGADIEVGEERTVGGEPVADISVRSSSLTGTVVEGDLLPRLIDEIPVLAVAAALARGPTAIRDAAELRVKESDRLATVAAELRRLGARLEERPDGLVIEGGARLRGAAVNSHGDHRLAMALAVAGLLAEGETVVAGSEAAAVSYPGFWRDLEALISA